MLVTFGNGDDEHVFPANKWATYCLSRNMPLKSDLSPKDRHGKYGDERSDNEPICGESVGRR